MRLISWNVANRVKKHAAQLRALEQNAPQIIALQEATATTIPLWRKGLEELGYQVISSFDLVDSHEYLTGGRKYGVLTASRWHMEALPPEDFEIPWPERVLSATVSSPWGDLELHNAHLPAGVSHGLVKVETFEGIYKRLSHDNGKIRILCGDFNSPQSESPDGTAVPFGGKNLRWSRAELSVIKDLADHDLQDVYRRIHGFEKQEMSWTIWNRGKQHGRRFDHVFASKTLNPLNCNYHHHFRDDWKLSDHAPIEVRFSPCAH